MSPQTRNFINIPRKRPPKLDGKAQSLSQIERHIALEKGKRICIVCGRLSPVSTSVAYPKGRSRRKQFDHALKLPAHVSCALPSGCYICGEHFRAGELECSIGLGPAQISDSVLPTLNLDYEFLLTLRSLKEDELEPKSAIRAAKAKLGWDTKPPQLINQSNGYESDESRDSSDPDTLVRTLFGKQDGKRRREADLPPIPQLVPKSIRLVPISNIASDEVTQLPPVLERMEDSSDDLSDLPPTLSPVSFFQIEKNVLTPKKPLPSTSRALNELQKKDQLIQRMKQSLVDKTTELNLLRKKLRITEELLQFYQDNHRNRESYELQEDCNSPNQTSEISSQATAMLMECSQSDLQQFLNGDQSD